MSTARLEASTEQQSTEGQLEVPQFRLGMILVMFAWPALWYTFLIYGLGRLFLNESGKIPTWVFLSVIVLGAGAELLAGILLLRREGHRLGWSWLRSRIRLQWPRGWKKWAIAVIAFIIAAGLGMAMGSVNRGLASVPAFAPPDWWPNASNPTVEVAGAGDVFPDINLVGNFGFVALYLLIGLLFNVVGEELYYRGYLLPRMRGVFGRFDWVANGVLFTLKHVYQRWLYPGILMGGLGFAFAAGPLGSLPLAMVYHWLGNFLLQAVMLVKAAAGM